MRLFPGCLAPLGMTTRLLLLSAILGLAGCQCGTRVVGADSELTIDPASVDFGTLRANQRASRELVARVTGRLAIDVTEVRVEQGADRFTTTATTGSIAPGGELRFTVDYRAPSTAGLDEATLVLIAATEVRVPLRGRVELSQQATGATRSSAST